jgi:hypothetical protein
MYLCVSLLIGLSSNRMAALVHSSNPVYTILGFGHSHPSSSRLSVSELEGDSGNRKIIRLD